MTALDKNLLLALGLFLWTVRQAITERRRA